MKIYVASPFGFSEAGRKFMYEEIIPVLEKLGFEILDPWKSSFQNEINNVARLPPGNERREAWEKLNPDIGKENEESIKKADGLVAILDGVDIDSGTASEIGYATALGKPVMAYRGDFRLSADNEGSKVNLQVEYFIHKHGGTIITKIADLEKELKRVFKAE